MHHPEDQAPQAAPDAALPTDGASTSPARASAHPSTPAGSSPVGAPPEGSPVRGRLSLRPLAWRRSGPATAPGDDAAQDEPVPEPTEATPTVSFRSPVSTGFLLTTGVLLALAVLGFLATNQQLLVMIMAALFIALGLDPIVRRFERWGAPRWAGVLVAALGLAAVAAAFISLLIPTAVEQSTQLAEEIPATVEEVMRSEWFLALDAQFHIQDAVRQHTDQLNGDGASVAALFGGIVGLGQTVLNSLFVTVVVVVLTLYFLSSLPHIKHWAYRLAPRSRRARVRELSEEVTSSVGLYVMGQTLVAALNATVAFIAMSIAGTPFAALLAFFAAIMAFIPLVGAMIGGTVITLISLLDSWQSAALFAAIYFVYLQVEAYVVSPRVMSRAVDVPAAVAVIAVIAGGTLLGVLGALMAIPTAAALLLIVREVFIPRQETR